MEVFGHLEQITAFVWDQLVKAPHQKRHPWRIATIANVVGQRVLQRSVVLRKAITNDRMLRFYTYDQQRYNLFPKMTVLVGFFMTRAVRYSCVYRLLPAF